MPFLFVSFLGLIFAAASATVLLLVLPVASGSFLTPTTTAKTRTTTAFFAASKSSPPSSSRSGSGEIYGVPGSGWTSPEWNWGYGSGTGHDCAAICRRRYAALEARKNLVDELLRPNNAAADNNNARDRIDFEEVKLVLALAWQRGRWDESDGGPDGGYGDVLSYMAGAERYEAATAAVGDDPAEAERECSERLVEDMRARYHLLDPTPEQASAISSLWDDCRRAAVDDVGRGVGSESASPSHQFAVTDLARRRCSGLVLDAMGFVPNGL